MIKYKGYGNGILVQINFWEVKMPYISLEVSKAIGEYEKEKLKKGIAEILYKIAEKPEEYLMVNIKERCEIWFKGEKVDCIYIDLKYIGAFSNSIKEKICVQFCKMCFEITEVLPENIYITFSEFEGENWGNNYKIFA